jgi:hypothetical protein
VANFFGQNCQHLIPDLGCSGELAFSPAWSKCTLHRCTLNMTFVCFCICDLLVFQVNGPLNGPSNSPLLGILVQHCINGHHRLQSNSVMGLLLLDSPFCSPSCQPTPICIHKPPGMVEEPLDDLCRACVQNFESTFLRIFKSHFEDFSVSSLAPPPILCESELRYVAHKK